MLILCATKTEATPIIKALKMQKIAYVPYSLFANKEHRLIVTGIGTILAAGACSYALSKNREPILNIGYAAGKSIGELYNIYKVIDRCTNKVFHLHKSDTLSNAACTTLPLPITEKLNTLADMEASAIIAVANRFKLSCTIYKITSDTFSPDACTRKSHLIERHLDTILSEISLQSAKFSKGKR